MTIQQVRTYNPATGDWIRHGFHAPVKEVEKEQVTPEADRAPDGPPKPGPGGSAGKSFREKMFNLEGSAEVIPDPHVQARSVVEFKGLGKQFSGRYFVKMVRHVWSSNGYRQTLEVVRNGFGGESDTGKQPSEQDPNRPAKELVSPATNDRYYTVRKGDTLWSISKQFYGKGTDYQKIAAANNITNANLIKVGQRLLIP